MTEEFSVGTWRTRTGGFAEVIEVLFDSNSGIDRLRGINSEGYWTVWSPAGRLSEHYTAAGDLIARADLPIGPQSSTGQTIRQLQSGLPWTGHYHRDFRATPMTHKDFGHALLHVHKAGGKLAAMIDDAEHGGVDWAAAETREAVGKYIADFVICALRMANTCPDGVIDLQAAVELRLRAKNNQLSEQAAGHRVAEKSA